MNHSHSNSEKRAHQATNRLSLALLLTLAFVVVEALAGFYANSLALLTDAVHNLTDVIALALSWYALRLTARPAHAGKTFGYHRSGILVALVNSTTLALISLWIFYEAYQRLLAPPAVDENILVAVAAVAFFINSGTAWMVHRGSEQDLNLRSSFIHLAGDALYQLRRYPEAAALLSACGTCATADGRVRPSAPLLRVWSSSLPGGKSSIPSSACSLAC